MKNLHFGKILYWLIATMPVLILFLYRPDLYQDRSFFNLTYNTIPKVLGVWGISLFATNLLLSNKIKIIDRLFGGLDKAYIFHKKMGKIVYLVLFLHFMAVSLRLLHISPDEILKFALDFSDTPVLLGRLAFYSMTIVIVITIFYRKRYEVVKMIHRSMPFILILGALHSMALPTSDIYPNLWLRLYIFTLINLAVITFLIRVIGQRYGYFTHRYTVEAVNSLKGNVTEVLMKPEGKASLNYKAGQFSFYRFEKNGWKYKGEEHPFSFTSAPENAENIKISAKASGDFTSQLNELKHGDKVYVNGGFGSFTVDKATHKNLVFIAGGIGITPFISMLRSLKASQNNQYEIDFYYAFRGEENSTYLEELHSYTKEGLINSLTIVDSEKDGHLTAEGILSGTDNLESSSFYICGPQKMIKQISNELMKSGVNKNQIHYELFSLFF